MNLLHDLRFAFRQLRHSPGFAFTAILILTLGIAANVIVFGALQGLILRPLNVPNPDQVMQRARTSDAYPVFSNPEVRDVRDNNTVFSAVAATCIYNVGLEVDGVSRPVWGYEVSGQYFEVTGIKSFLGRLLERADDVHPNASDAAVLSWSAWKSYFGADPDIVGKKVRINKRPYRIVGVTPEGFYGTEKFFQPDIFIPLARLVTWLGKSHEHGCRFQPAKALRTEFDLGWAGYNAEAAAHFQRELLDRVSHLPGVQAAGYAISTPLSLEVETSGIFSETTTDFRNSNLVDNAFSYSVSPGYFNASGTPLLAGRDVSFLDTPDTPAVAIVNRQFAREVFHSEDAIGRYFKRDDGRPVQIVGLVADGKYLVLSEDPAPAVFFPASQQPKTSTVLIVQTAAGDATAEMAATIRKVIRDLDTAVPIRDSGSWANQLALSLFPSQAATVALGLFGGFGLLLSVTGTFSVASYTVGRRLRELSIRVALGARGKQILWAALGRMLMLLACGSVAGILLGVAASQILSAIVYQASAQDPLVLVAVALTVLVTGFLAVAGPVRRALHVDPARLLREQ